MLKSKLPDTVEPAFDQALPEVKLKAVVTGSLAPTPASASLTRLKLRLKLITPILISMVLSVVGQIILKRGMSDLGPISLTNRSLWEIAFTVATDPFVVVGLAIFAVSVLFWLAGLSRVPLSYAYPFVSLSFVMILIGSALILGEPLNLLRLGGVVVICGGVLVVAFS